MNYFDPTCIYNTLFINVVTVRKFKFFSELPENLQNDWQRFSEKKYPDSTNAGETYEKNGNFYPEFSKIVGITHANVFASNDELKRNINFLYDEDEFTLLNSFLNELYVHKNAKNLPTLCGHNIINHDIPVLVKKIVEYRERIKQQNNGEKVMPTILKQYLMAKPWDSNIIDTINLWKFNGSDYTSLNTISDFMNLKKNIILLRKDVIDEQYWEIENSETKKDLIKKQSLNYVNVAIQMLNEIRQL